MNSFTIANRPVGPEQHTFVIAELGVNHDGSMEHAQELIAAAARSGADAVKLQIYQARRLMNGSSRLAVYQEQCCGQADPAAFLSRYELTDAQVRQLVHSIAEAGMIPLATPFSLADVDLVRSLGLPAVKIASPDIVNRPLLQSAARLGTPMLLSTGAATMEEIRTTVQWLRQWETAFALLHCVGAYPTPTIHANLCWIGELAREYGVPIGYSDHTTETMCGALAVAAGACIVEKHLTYDRNADGPDHALSATPRQFASYVRQIREAEQLRGLPGKHLLDIEQDVRQVSRQSLVAARALHAGQVIAEADLAIQRPGTGIPAARLADTLGRTIARPVKAGTLLQWDMIADAA